MHKPSPLTAWLPFLSWILAILGWAFLAQPVQGQPAKLGQPTGSKGQTLADRLISPREADRPIVEKLRSPRETVKTLYYAVTLYDLFPEMMQDAIACLELEQARTTRREDVFLMALDLEYVLQSLSLPLNGIPDQDQAPAPVQLVTGKQRKVVLYDADGLKVALCHCQDDGWRFDRDTLQRLPAMRRIVQERRRQRPRDVTSLREGFTDPRATLRQFIADAANGDFHAAGHCLDLTSFSNEQRHQQGPVLAQQLAFVLQHRGFMFRQEVPDLPDGPSYTWHADQHGRIALDRVHLPNGKDAWLFTKQTVRSIPRMYAATQALPPAPQYARLGLLIQPLRAQAEASTSRKRPEEVPPHLGSPRALLQGFFRTMDAADMDDSRLVDALEFLDLDNVPVADRGPLGAKLAVKLEAVLRKVRLDLSAVPDDWNAGRQILGEAQGIHIETLRQRDGCWRFSQATVAHIPEMFDKLAGKAGSDEGRGSHLDSARDTIITFQTSAARREFTMAAQCIDLSAMHASAREELGPVLAFKLKYVLDRTGRLYVQEIPDNPDGPRYVLYRGELGRIALERQMEESVKGQWLFTADTVQRIEPMFRAVLGQPLDESQRDVAGALDQPRFWETPGIWLRLKIPDWLQVRAGMIELYQWLGLTLAALAGWLGARLLMVGVSRSVAWLLHRSGSVLSNDFVARALRPLTWLATVWLFFQLLDGLDLPIAVATMVFTTHKFLHAGLFAWLGLRLIDLSMGVYLNSERLRPHRSLSDMIVPVSMRISKTIVLLVVATYVIYQIGQIDLLARFLTGLGVAGLAASLAAQDALKSFFGTLLLIGERAFKIGDRIDVGGKEGVVEQVGFRSTRLRTSQGSTLTIPNAVIASAAINNMGTSAERPAEQADASLSRHPGQAA